MTASWPNSLPQAPLVGTLGMQGQDNLVRGPADVGQGPRRRRASAVSRAYTFTMLMTGEQVNILESFYDNDLGSGAYDFSFTDPLLKETRYFSFSERHQVQHDQADIFRVTLNLLRKAE